MHLAKRYHDFSYGHRVYGHESKCAHLHGHNGRVHFTCAPKEGLDTIGRVLDFSVIKEKLCSWVEANWDHRFLVWEGDPLRSYLISVDPEGVVVVPFNPTAEKMAEYLVEVIGPELLKDTDCVLQSCIFEETVKCSAFYVKDE